MAERNEVVKKLEGVFQDVFDDDDLQIQDSTTADDIDEWDSLMHVTLVISIEKSFGLTINASEVAEFENVGGMIDLIVRKLNS
ncbi:MAG: acyl carrier protein [Planctomycetota bacterium]|nr:MAG: acyl carrier protein [Planctomycetota bacterium]